MLRPRIGVGAAAFGSPPCPRPSGEMTRGPSTSGHREPSYASPQVVPVERIEEFVDRRPNGSTRSSRSALSLPSRAGSIPLAFGETAKRDQSDQGDDDPEHEAPHDRDDDPDDYEDPAGTDSSDRAAPSAVSCHARLP